MSDALSNLKDHAPTLPSASDVRDAVQSHLPSVDIAAVKDAVKDKAMTKSRGKRSIAVLIGGLAGAAALFSYLRRRRSTSDAPASMYTPPLPRP